MYGPIEIYSETIRLISPPRNNAYDVDPFDDEKVAQTLAHEVGHGVAIPHWRKDTKNRSESCQSLTLMSARPLTVMVGCWFEQTKKLSDRKWNSIPHSYDDQDLGGLRLKWGW